MSERKHYDELIKEGGRPLFSIDLLDKIIEDPLSHWDLLRPWVQYPPYIDPDPEEAEGADWNVFWEQMWSWRRFRKWQKYIRKNYAGWDSTFAHVQGEGRALPDYTEAVKTLLAEYDFTRPFQLQKDPMHQDRLTTWIEYLGYECWLHHRLTQRMKCMQPGYDAAWKKLVGSNVLRPFETEEYVCHRTMECALRHQSEEDQATKVVESSKLAAEAVVIAMYKDAHNSKGACLNSEQRMQRMLEAKSRLEAAKESLVLIKRRNDLVTEFKQAVELGPYLTAKEDAKRHSLRIRWILDQVPLIEAESNGSSVVKTGSDALRGMKRRIGSDTDDEAAQGRRIQKQRRNARNAGPQLAYKAGSGYEGGKPKRSREDAADDRPPSKRLRKGGGDLNSPVEIFDNVNIRLGKDLQGSEIPAVRRGNSEGLAVKTAERPHSKGSKYSNNLGPRKDNGNACPSSTTSQPLRRSARIATLREKLQAVTTSCGAAGHLP